MNPPDFRLHSASRLPCAGRRTGFTLTEVLVAIGLVTVLLAILIPAVQQAREASRMTQCRNNLKNIGVACHDMQANTRYFPAIGKLIDGGEFGFSSLVQLLPYAEQTALYQSFDFKTYPAAKQNRAVIDQTPVTLWKCPGAPFTYPQLTSYLGNSGTGFLDTLEPRDDGFLGDGNGVGPGDFTDGLSNTVAFTECRANSGIPPLVNAIINVEPRATTGDEFEQFQQRCQALTSSHIVGREGDSRSFGEVWTQPTMGASRYNHLLPPGSNSCDSGGAANLSIITPSSHHSNVLNTLLADGSVRSTSLSIDIASWRNMGSRGSD